MKGLHQNYTANRPCSDTFVNKYQIMNIKVTEGTAAGGAHNGT